MNRKYFYFILAFTTFSLLLILVFFTTKEPELQANQDVQVQTPSFQTYVSGTGIVEPVSGNVMISSPFSRVVGKINVAVNDQVKKGDVLFELYNQDLSDTLKVKQQKYDESLSNLSKLESFPRQEDLTIAQETFNKAQAAFNQANIEYCLSSRCARSNDEKLISLYKFNGAEADYRAAQAQFEKIQAGTWQPELKIAQEESWQAKTEVEAAEAELGRTIIKSPIDGTVLQLKIHEGEIPDVSKPALVLGNVEQLNLRVSIDQFNQLRFRPECRAVAYKQGDISMEFPLEFIMIEPVMVPKKYLTNELNEKVDTQVFEILYRIKSEDAHLLIGEQMDVYIYVDEKQPSSLSLPPENSGH